MKKKKVRSLPLSDPPLCSCGPSIEEEEEEATSSSNRRSRRKDDSELVELSEGSHDESEAELSGSDNDEDDD